MIEKLFRNKLKNFQFYNLEELSTYEDAIDKLKKDVEQLYKIGINGFLWSMILLFIIESAVINFFGKSEPIATTLVILGIIIIIGFYLRKNINAKFLIITSIIAFILLLSISIYKDSMFFSNSEKLEYANFTLWILTVVNGISFLFFRKGYIEKKTKEKLNNNNEIFKYIKKTEKNCNQAGRLFLLTSNSVTKDLLKKYYGILYFIFINNDSLEFCVTAGVDGVYKRKVNYSDISNIEKITIVDKEIENDINKLDKLRDKKNSATKEVVLSNISRVGTQVKSNSTFLSDVRVNKAYQELGGVNSEIRKTEDKVEKNTNIYKIELNSEESFLISHVDKNSINKLIDNLNKYIENNSEFEEVIL